MRCPFCNKDDTRVVDSRSLDDVNAIRRRRLCDACHRRFNTYERVEAVLPLTVIKKDQTRQIYSRAKLTDGILRACYKRPIPMDVIQETIDKIEEKIYSMNTREVQSSVIGELVMEELKNLDDVSYVRFASVYRQFKDVGTFMEELKKIMG